jgi:crossover junction endodeoxyribonuclease RuvC
VAAVRILGIDPGTQIVGFGCVEVAVDGGRAPEGAVPLALRASNVVRASSASTGDVRLIEAGVLRLGGRGLDLPARLRALAEQFRSLVGRLAPCELAIEQAFHGKSAQAALRIGEARGVLLAEAAAACLDVHQFAPARVKRCVAGRGAASKESVAAMVRLRLGREARSLPEDLAADATDALAVALVRLEERSSPLVALLAAERAGTLRSS